MSQKILDCHHHDHLEAACVLAYQVVVTTDEGEIQGIARDLSTSNKQEWFHLESSNGITKIDLLDIVGIKVLTPNAQFTEVKFR